MKKLFSTALVALGLTAAVSPTPVQAQATPYYGTVIWVGFNFCPRGWAPANGQLLSIASNTALFSLYGTTYGGDGRTTFALPDLQGRVPTGQGSGPGLPTVRLGEKYGAEAVTMTLNQLPSHNHSAQVKASSSGADSASPANTALAGANIYVGRGTPDTLMNDSSIVVGNTGNSSPISLMQPYLVQLPCVALQGIYPSRS